MLVGVSPKTFGSCYCTTLPPRNSTPERNRDQVGVFMALGDKLSWLAGCKPGESHHPVMSTLRSFTH